MAITLSTHRVIKEAESNKLKLTPQFLELKFIEAIADNTKIFFGEKVFKSLLYHSCASVGWLTNFFLSIIR